MGIVSRFPLRRDSSVGNDRAPQTDSGNPEKQRPLIPRHRRRPIVVGLLSVAVALGCWLGFQAFQAKSNLEEARNDAERAKEALLSGSVEDATKWMDEAHSNARRARDATHSLPWNIAAGVPWLGGPFETAQQISDVALDLVVDVLQPSIRVGAAISPDRLLEGGGLNVQLLRAAEPELSEISAAAARVKAQASTMSDPNYLGVVRDALTELRTHTSDVSRLLQDAALAARLAPAMMGADGPRTYFIGFQTNTEARGTGGLLGGLGTLRFDNGTPTVDTLASDTELNKAFHPIDLGPEYEDQYGSSNPTIDFRNSNLSSHFPYTAQIWDSMWQQQSGAQVDGVIAIDPVALSYILDAVGSVTTPGGESVTKDNVVELTESTARTHSGADNIAPKQYLQDIAGEVIKKMADRVASPRQLLEALGNAVGEGHIAVWSSSPDEQQLLEETPLAHAVSADPAPYAAVVINNLGGNRLDYYLKREIRYTAGMCDGDSRKSSVIVRLTNTVPAEEYVVGSAALTKLAVEVPSGTNVMSVSLLATTHATLMSAYINSVRMPVFTGTERGHPIFELEVPVQRGQTVELKYELTEPTSPGAPRVPIQPLLDNVAPFVSVPECSG
jgi:hypothetical protein